METECPGLQQAFAATKKWVVFRLGHMGDVILTTGVLRHWHECYGVHFRVITSPAWVPIFQENFGVEHVIPFPKGGVRQELAFMKRTAHEHAGWGFLDMHGILRSYTQGMLWQGPVARYKKMGLERRAFLYTGSKYLSKKLQALRVTQRYALALERHSVAAAKLLPKIWVSDQEQEQARASLYQRFGSLVCPIAIHPFSTHLRKSWPPERWLQLLELLKQRHIPYILLGKGAFDAPLGPENYCNQTTLRETCALLQQCAGLVTGDSGPMHLAAAVQTPVVALLGPTTAEWGFYPAGPRDVVLEQNMPCRPCSLHGKKHCPREGQCLLAITVEDVMAQCSSLFMKELGV